MDLLDDIKQLVFSYCNWKQYHELCTEHKLPVRLKLLNDLPSINKICTEKIEYFEIVRYLHENGVSITTHALNLATVCGHFEIVKYLHTHGVPITNSAIIVATKFKYFKIVNYFKLIKQN